MAGPSTFSNQFAFTSDYWLIDGVTGGGPTAWESNYGFQITETGASNPVLDIGRTGSGNFVTIRHCKLTGMNNGNTNGGSAGNDGVAVLGKGNITLSYLWIQNVGRCPFFLSPVGAGGIVVEYCNVGYFYGSTAAHAEIASIYPVYGNVVFRWSLFRHSYSTGGIMWGNEDTPSTTISVYGNVFYQPAGVSWAHGNGVLGGWTTSANSNPTMNNFFVYNNTFVNVDYLPLSTLPAKAAGCVAVNNLFYNTASPDFTKFPTHDYNYFINSGGTHGEANGTSATSGDPFVDYVNLDFSLKANTAAGKNLGAPYNIDMMGKVRSTWSRGAYEFGTTTTGAPTSPQNLRVLAP